MDILDTDGDGHRTIGLAVVLDALASETRRTILERLRVSPLAIGELADELPVSRPAVSQHMRILVDAGLVGTGPGLRRRYRIEPAGLSALRTYLAGF